MNRLPSPTAQHADDPRMNLEEASQAILATVTTIKRIAQKISLIDQIASRDGAAAFNAAIEASHARGVQSSESIMLEVSRLAERSEVAALEIGNLAGFSGELAARAGVLLEEMIACIGQATTLLKVVKPGDQGTATTIGADGRHA